MLLPRSLSAPDQDSDQHISSAVHGKHASGSPPQSQAGSAVAVETVSAAAFVVPVVSTAREMKAGIAGHDNVPASSTSLPAPRELKQTIQCSRSVLQAAGPLIGCPLYDLCIGTVTKASQHTAMIVDGA